MAKERTSSVRPVLVASATSTLISRALTYPADTVKARLQLQGALRGPAQYKSTLHAFIQVLRVEGLSGFYRGFIPVLSGVLPATMVYFYSYELAKQHLAARLGAVGDFAAGAAAQLSAGVVFTPVDVIKERLQVQRMMGHAPATASQALRLLLRHEGPQGLLRGYWMTNSVWIPWTSIYVALYEASKRRMARSLGAAAPEELPAWAFAACSGTSAAAAAVFTHPLDVVKTRLQVLTASPEMRAKTATGIAREMLRREGPHAFWHGGVARLLQIAPGSAISWLLYERIKLKLTAAHNRI